MSNLAIIPARGGSKGVPKKNIRNFNGLPLIAYTIQAAGNINRIDRLIVSTDSDEIAEVAVRYGAEVPFLRPENLASDTSNTIDVILHAIEFFEEKGTIFDDILLLQPTSPFRDSSDIDNALDIYYSRNCESVISVCEASVHPNLLRLVDEQGIMRDFINLEDRHMRRQDMTKVYQLNGAIYITSVDNIKQTKSFYCNKTVPYIMSAEKSLDIDTELDFRIAEFIMANR